MSKKPHSKLWLYFTGIISATIFIVFAGITMVWVVLFALDVIQIDPGVRHIPIAMLSLWSILLGAILTLFVGKLMIRPIQNMSEAFDELSNGNFSVEIPTDE